MATEIDEGALLAHLATAQTIPDSFLYAASHTQDHQALIGLLNSLSADGLLTLTPLTTHLLDLTSEGASVLAQGSPEWRVFDAIPAGAEGTTQEALVAALGKDAVKIGMGPLMKTKGQAFSHPPTHLPIPSFIRTCVFPGKTQPLIHPPSHCLDSLVRCPTHPPTHPPSPPHTAIKKAGDKLVRNLESLVDETKAQLALVQEGKGETIPEEVVKVLRKRQLVSQVG